MKLLVLSVVVMSCALVSASSPIQRILQPRFQEVGKNGPCHSVLTSKNCPSSFSTADSWPKQPGAKGGSPRGTVSTRCETFDKADAKNILFLTREVNDDTMAKYVKAGYIGARGLVDPSSGKVDLKKGGGAYIYTRIVSTASTNTVGKGSTGSGSPIMILFSPFLLARSDSWAASIDGMGCPPFRVCKGYSKFSDCQKALFSTLTKAQVDECQDKSPGQDGDSWGGGKYNPATIASIAKDAPAINEQGFFGSIPFTDVKAIIYKEGNRDAAGIRSHLGMTDSKYDHIIFKTVTSGDVKSVLTSEEQTKVCGP